MPVRVSMEVTRRKYFLIENFVGILDLTYLKKESCHILSRSRFYRTGVAKWRRDVRTAPDSGVKSGGIGSFGRDNRIRRWWKVDGNGFRKKAEDRFPGADILAIAAVSRPFWIGRAQLRNGLRTRHAGSNVLECTYAREYATFRMQLHNVSPPL